MKGLVTVMLGLATTGQLAQAFLFPTRSAR